MSAAALLAKAHFLQNENFPGTICAQTCDVRCISYTQQSNALRRREEQQLYQRAETLPPKER